MRRRILYTTAAASPQSGAYRILLDMVHGVRSQGWESVLVLPATASGCPASVDPADVRTYFLRLPETRAGRPFLYYARYLWRTLRSVRELVAIIRKERPAIVHVNEILDVYAAVAAKIAGARCLWNVRADLSAWPVMEWVLPRLASLIADTVVVASESVRREMFQGTGIDSTKVRVLYDPGFDFSAFHPGVARAPFRQELKLTDDDPLVVMVAKLSRRKGHEILLRAVPAVLTRHPNAHFVVVGGRLEGSHHEQYADELASLVASLGLQDHVTFTGYRSDVPSIMAAAEVVTHCSVYPDPFPGVVLQGMAMGKAVVASDLGGTREQIEHNVSGVLVPAGDAGALAEALSSLLSDRKRRAALGEVAAQQVHSRFGFDSYFERLAHLYDQLCV